MSITPRVARKSNELREECKWIFVSVIGSTDTNVFFKSKTQFKNALQCCGRNPSLKKVDQYWSQYSDGIGYEEFCKIVNKESVIGEAELLEAFRQIDVDHDGFISYNELYKTLTSKGEKMSEDEVDDILNNADSNHDGKLNYKEFSRLVMDTIEQTKVAARKRMKQIVDEIESKQDGKRSRESSRGRTTPNLRDERAKSPSVFSYKMNNSFHNNSPSDDDNRSIKSKSSLQKKKSQSRSNHNSDSDEMGSSKKNQDLIEIKLPAPNKVESSFNEPKMLKKWLSQKIKGAYYINDSSEHILSQSYVLDLNEDSKVFFEIEPFSLNLHKDENWLKMDMLLIIVQDNKARTVRAITEHKIENKWCAKCELKAGRYFVFPFTSGCRFKKRQMDEGKPVKLFHNNDGRNKLTKEFIEALNVVFDLSDLDSNGRLSKREFQLYTSLTSNEVVDAEGWNLVEETVGFEKNELTRNGFIELYKIEASQDGIDVNEIWSRLYSLGFNKYLQIDQACPYKITVSAEQSEFKIHASEIYQIKIAESYLNDYILERGQQFMLKYAKHVVLYEYHNSHLACLLVKNERDDGVDVELNCEESENCISNHQATKNYRPFKPYLRMRPKKQKLAIFMAARNENKDWHIRCLPNLVNN